MKVGPFKRTASITVALIAYTLPMSIPARALILCDGLAATVEPGQQKYKFDRLPCAEEEHRPIIDGKNGEAAKEADALMAWIVQQTHWTLRERPPIQFIPSTEIQKLLAGKESIDLKMEAFYSEKDHGIYLSDSWQPDDLRDRSILLHELVHHLQYLNHVKDLCPSEFEFQAFKLQVDWLREKGVEYPVDLIGIDPLILLMLGHCDEMSF
jgi:hypothetical protein